MTIKPAGAADVGAIVALVNGAYRGASAEAGWTHEAALLEGQRTDEAMIHALVAGAPGAILLAREGTGRRLLGCVAVSPTDAVGVWSVGMLTVDPHHQAAGVGRRLLAAGEAFAATRGATGTRMTVIALRDMLIAYYERRGYRLTGETEPFPYGDARIGRPKRDDLRFVVMEKPIGPAT